MSPRSAKGLVRREDILEAAGAVVRERGLGGARISDIAERLRVSEATPLYYFGSRERLLEAGLAHAERRWFAEVRDELEALPTATEQLVRLIERAVPDDAADGTWRLWIELWSEALRHSGMAALRARLDGEWRELMMAIVARGRARGEFPSGDPAQVALILACLLDGFGVERALGSDRLPAVAARAVCLEVASAQLGIEL